MPPKSKRGRQSAEAALKARQKLQEGFTKVQSSQPQPSESHAPAQIDIDITPSDDRESTQESVLETLTGPPTPLFPLFHL